MDREWIRIGQRMILAEADNPFALEISRAS